MITERKNQYRIFSAVLAGNPNVGKSTVFNALTGMKQHTGNWPGKTVVTAEGHFRYKDCEFVLTDLPGTYSLNADSPDEEAAKEAILYNNPDCIIIVADASALERNLNLILHILEISTKAVVCLNLIDEARKKQINPNSDKLSSMLGVPVITAAARSGKGLDKLMAAAYDIACGNIKTSEAEINYGAKVESAANIIKNSLPNNINSKRFLSLELLDKNHRDEILRKKHIPFTPELERAIKKADNILSEYKDIDYIRSQTIVNKSEEIYNSCVTIGNKSYNQRDRRIDKIMTSKRTGIPIMLLLLALVFYITIIGANYPSQCLAQLFDLITEKLRELFSIWNVNSFLSRIFIDGMVGTLGSVVSVMLPPMAVFFPLFSLLEDLGYLPRVAFNLDRCFYCAGTQGKQALTMMMGFGCNACGITGCRIIETERERKIAALTNNFSPCNGRFPTLIAIISAFLVGGIPSPLRSFAGAAMLVGVIILSIIISLAASKLLSLTVLKGKPSSLVLELPPYRRPQFLKTIIRSIIDKTLAVLGRAVVVAIPAGIIISLLANTFINGQSIISYITAFLDPFAHAIGLDGVMLTAFILGFPANEIVLPIALMIYLSNGTMTDYDTFEQLHSILTANGWTTVTAICVMIFTVMHFPCSTACLTFYKETKSIKWTLAAFFLPTLCGIICCLLVNAICYCFSF